MSHLYVHIPFCAHRCGYCDFVATSDIDAIPDYISALKDELNLLYSRFVATEEIVLPLKTIYIGGGTPSILSSETMKEVLIAITSLFGQPTLEWTVEMNPESVTVEKLRILKQYGVNRISLGMQALQSTLLETLERSSRYNHVEEAVESIKALGFDHLSLDVIYGIPGQTCKAVEETLEAVLHLNPDHISTYALKLEPHTPMGEKWKSGALVMPSDDEVADQLDCIIDTLESNGYSRYEISNFSKNGCESQHNLAYWNGANTLGVGVGAVYLVKGIRYENTTSIQDYSKKIQAGQLPYTHREMLSVEDLMYEMMILSFRCSSGLDAQLFENRFGKTVESVYGEWLLKYTGLGLVVKTKSGYALTRRGMEIENLLMVDLT